MSNPDNYYTDRFAKCSKCWKEEYAEVLDKDGLCADCQLEKDKKEDDDDIGQ